MSLRLLVMERVHVRLDSVSWLLNWRVLWLTNKVRWDLGMSLTWRRWILLLLLLIDQGVLQERNGRSRKIFDVAIRWIRVRGRWSLSLRLGILHLVIECIFHSADRRWFEGNLRRMHWNRVMMMGHCVAVTPVE